MNGPRWVTAAIVSLSVVTAIPLLGLVGARAAGVWVQDAFAAAPPAPSPVTDAAPPTSSPTATRPSAAAATSPRATAAAAPPTPTLVPLLVTPTPAPLPPAAVQTAAVRTAAPTLPPVPTGEWSFELNVFDGLGHLSMPAASGTVSALPGKPLSGLNYAWGQAPAVVAVVGDEDDSIGRCCTKTNSVAITWPGQATCVRADTGATVFSGGPLNETTVQGAALNCTLSGFTTPGLRRFVVKFNQTYVYGMTPITFSVVSDAVVPVGRFAITWNAIPNATIYCVDALDNTFSVFSSRKLSKSATCGPWSDLEPTTISSYAFGTLEGGHTYFIYVAAFAGGRMVGERSINFTAAR